MRIQLFINRSTDINLVEFKFKLEKSLIKGRLNATIRHEIKQEFNFLFPKIDIFVCAFIILCPLKISQFILKSKLLPVNFDMKINI